MSAFCFHRLGRAALAAAGIGLTAAHAPAFATTDLSIGAVTCVPGTPQTVQQESVLPIKLTAIGAIQRAGPSPPLLYYCPVFSPDDFATEPSWRRLALQYRDPNVVGNGRVRARLFRKNRTSGASGGGIGLVASVSSVPSAAVKVVSSPLPALDFSTFAYYIVLDVNNTGALPIEAHTVMLTN